VDPIIISLIAFACFFGGGLLGMRLRASLPQAHLADDSRHLLETGLGVIGTIGGLVLGLLVGSSFGSYNTQRSSLVELSANIIVLDRALALYGPGADGVRADLRTAVQRMLDQIWGGRTNIDPTATRSEGLYIKLLALKAGNEQQTTIKGQATGMAVAIAKTRWLMYAQRAAGVSVPLLVMLIFWFTVTFVGLGIFTRSNTTVIVALFLAAVAVAGAVFLLQEMYMPFQGPMQISPAPLRAALDQLGKPV
jgi:hypothetical protein